MYSAPNQSALTQITRRFIIRFLALVLTSSTLSIITPQFANAATVGSAPCVQTVDNSANVEVTSSSGYCYVAFKSGTRVWTPPTGVSAIDLLVVAGGGGGASRHAGGGGAGGLLQSTGLSINSTDLTITVGAGGPGGALQSSGGTSASDGANSIVSGGGIAALTAIGGGGGGYGVSVGRAGGSGGGGGSDATAGGIGTVGPPKQGNDGSKGITSYPGSSLYWVGGGGGGAGATGTTSLATKGGSGGVGVEVTWIPTSVGSTLTVGVAGSTGRFFAGGGGGGSDRNSISGGDGGTGGGGAGSTGTATANNGIANTGGGGGGSGVSGVGNGSLKGGDGGSGVVIIRYVNWSYSVTYNNSNSAFPSMTGGAAPSTQSGSTQSGSITLSSYTSPPSGFTFAGWATSNGSSTVVYTNQQVISISSDLTLTLFPVWGCSPSTTTTGGYTSSSFTAVGTCIWNVPAGVTTADVLVVGGGGAGGTASNGAGGGGGGGQVNAQAGTALSGVVTIKIGAGGTPNQTVGNSTAGGIGGTSSFTPTSGSAISAIGGSGGASVTPPTGAGSPGSSGFNGGGGAAWASSFSNGTNGVGGNKGGNAWPNGSDADPQAGGGGGGSGANGANASSGVGGVGGAGISNSYTGSAVVYGGGGGGGKRTASGSSGLGGSGGGGAGGKVSVGANATANTGGGGGGAGGEFIGGSGGSGIVVVKNVNSFTVTYDTQGGSAIASGSTVTGGSISASPGTPTRDGFTFNGWFAASTGGSAITFSYTHNQIANFTIYAQWLTNYVISVTQTANGTISPSNTTVASGSNATFTFTPAAGYEVDTILIDGVSLSTPASPNLSDLQSAILSGYTFSNVTSNRTISATYTAISATDLLLNLDATRSSSLPAASGASPVWTSITPGATIGATGSSSTQIATASTTTPNTPKSVYFNNSGTNSTAGSGASMNFGKTTGVSLGTTGQASPATVEMWINPKSLRTGAAPWNILFTKWFTDINRTGPAADQEFHYSLKWDGTNIRQNLYTSSCTDKYGSKTFSSSSDLNKWYLIGFTVDASGNLQFYVNGKTDGSSYSGCGITIKNTPIAFIGDLVQAAGFDGSIGKVRFYKTALNAATMQNNYNVDAKLFAQSSIYTITYDYSNATSGNSTLTSDYTLGGTAITLPTPVRTGYTFNGWFTQSSGGSKIGDGGATYTPTATATIYAQWNVGSVTIATPSTGLTGTVGTSYTLNNSVSGGTGSGTYTLASGSLPGSVTLNSSTGVISGTPTTAGTFTITVSFTDASTAAATTNSFSIVIASAAALTPTFGTPTATADGFTVQISNYSASYTWAGSATASGSVAISGTGLVTVTGVAPGTSSTATITTSRTGYTGGSANITAVAALVVDLDASNTSSYPGTGATWTNLVNGTNYTITSGTFNSSNGGSIVFNGSSTFVNIGTPLAAGASFTQEAWVYDASGVGSRNIVSSSSHVLFFSGTTLYGGLGGAFTLVSSANFPKNTWRHVVLTFNDATNTMTLYINGVQVSQNTNVTSSYTQETMRIGSHVSGATPVSFWNGRIAKLKIYTGALSSSAVTASYDSISSTYILGAALTPTFGTPTATADGFTVSITDYDSAFTWATPTVSAGSVAITSTSGATRVLTVTGLSPGASATITQNTSRSGYENGSATVTGTATTGAALTPTFGTPTATADGFTVQISNYSASYTWAGSATASGSVAINGTGLVTVTGVAAGTSSTATITTTRTGYTNGSATVSATSLTLYTVTYDATTNGGTAISPLTANFTVGGTALVLPTPVARTGYTASGWYTTAAVAGTKIADAGGTYTPTSTGTIYFRWSANTYTITYKAGPDGSGSDLTQSFEFGNTATLKDATAALTRSGYAISGWTTGATSASAKTNDLSSSYTTAANLILYPVWGATTYTITYKAGTGGSGSDLTQTFVYGNTATLKDATAALTKSGYAISGWSTTDGGSQSYALSGSYSAAANIDLYPVWGANTYTITYKPGASGTGSDVIQSFTFGSSATLGSASTALIRVGYTISGWSTTDGGSKTNDLSSSYSTAANLILYPVWNANTYTVTYDATTNGGTAISPNTASFTVAGATLTLPTPASRAGYTASGWYTAASSGTKVGNAGASGYTPSSDLTLYFQWTPIQYTVTYDGNSNTGGAVPTNASTYTIGSTVTVAANSGTLVNTGYTFTGWTDNSSGTGTVYTSGTSYTVSSANITFYAKWSANTYTITYNANGGSGAASATSDSYTTAGTPVTLPTVGTLAKTGYNFGGWSTTTSGSALVGGYTTATDVTLYARWTVKTINLTYDKGVASSASIASWPANDSGNYNTTITLGTPTSQVTISGGTYQFSSWKVSGTTVTYEAGATYTLPATNPTLIAQWVQVFEVNYTLNGGTSATGYTYDSQCDPGTYLCTNGQSIQADATPTRTGYTFTSWRDQSGNPIAAGATFTVTLNRYLLSAQWSAVDYNITYAAAGGGAVPATFTKQITQSFTVANAISRSGYSFAGWSDGTLTYGAGATYTVSSSDVTLTAQWTANVYTITYDWNGGSGSSTSSTSYTVGNSAVTLPLVGDHVKDGYLFGGWSTSSSGTSVGLTYTPTSSLTLYAVWGSGTFTITYNANGGSTGTTSAIVVNGATTTLPSATRTSYEFNGWYTADSGGSLIGLADASYTPALSRTLYAQWTQLSLSGISSSDLTYIGTLSASSSIDASFSGSNSGSSVSVSVPAGSLPNGTSVNLHLVGNFSRAQSLISNLNNYIVSIVVSWVAADGTVPDTAPGKPVTVVISNTTIKRGMSVYSIIGPTVTLLGTATADNSITVALTSDPEVVVAATKPEAPTSVSASSGANASSVISWSAPSSDGGSAITRYTATSSGGQSCITTSATTCTISGLTNGTAYTFTVTATNVIGVSNASSASASATPAGASSGGGSSGGGSSGGGSSGGGSSGGGSSGGGSSGGGSSGGGTTTPEESKKDDKSTTPGQGGSGGNPIITIEKKSENVKLSWEGSSQVTLTIENSKGVKRSEVVVGNTLTLPKPKPGEGYKVSSETPLANGTYLKDYIVAEPPTKPVTFSFMPSKVIGTVSTIRANWKATSSFERFSIKVTPVRGKAFLINTNKPFALINLPQGMKYTITVTAIGYGSLKSKLLTKVISVPKRR